MNKKKKMGAKAPAKKTMRGGKAAGYMTTRRLSASAAKSGQIQTPPSGGGKR